MKSSHIKDAACVELTLSATLGPLFFSALLLNWCRKSLSPEQLWVTGDCGLESCGVIYIDFSQGSVLNIQLKINSVLSVYEKGCWLSRLTSCAASGFQMSHQALVLKYYGALHRAGFSARPAHQSLAKPIRVILTSRPYKSSRANMSQLNCHSPPPCLLRPLRTQTYTNWGITFMNLHIKTTQME